MRKKEAPEKCSPGLESDSVYDTVSNMEQIQTKLDQIQDYAKSLELDIFQTQEQIESEDNETHIIFLTDHLQMLRFEMHKTNVAIYILRKN